MNSISHERGHFITKTIIASILFSHAALSSAMEVPIYDFPITAYSQNANNYLPSNDKDYTKTLLTKKYQKMQLTQFYNHYYSTDPRGLSPWSKQMILLALPAMKKNEPEILEEFNNQNKASKNKHFAENFKEHGQIWWNKIKDNMNLTALASSEFKKENRAIAVANTFARALPEASPDFFSASLPGQGFPFDNLQESAIWAGTPLYVLSVSKDKAWSLVLTPEGYFAWVKTNDIAYVSSDFIQRWQKAAHHNLIAVTQTEATIVDAHQQFQFTGYIGAVFPMVQRTSQQTTILIPVKNNHNQAVIKKGVIKTGASSVMPLAASRQNLVKIINQLKNRPYGWGGAYFYNDCSQETKSIFTPFGIWLPRNSTQQSKLTSTPDLAKNTIDERLNFLKEKGHPLMTLIYVGGHVMLYIGNKDLDHNKKAVITYQNVWGISPKNHDKRYLIGQSLFLPLLKYYPERPEANSQAAKANFKLVFLDELKSTSDTPQEFAKKLF